MYKESIDRENKKLKDELRVLKTAMRNIASDSPLRTDLPATRDPLKMQLSSPKGSFSSQIPGLKTLIEASKSRDEDYRSTPRSSSRARGESIATEAENIKSEVESELASLREKLDSMKVQYKKPPTPPVPVLPGVREVAVQTEVNAYRTSSQQTDSPRTLSQGVQTFSRSPSPEEPREKEEEKEEDVDPELLSEYQLLRDENAALRTLLKRKEERSGKKVDKDCDTVPTRERPSARKTNSFTKDSMKSPRNPCSFCTYLRSQGLPTTACRRHFK